MKNFRMENPCEVNLDAMSKTNNGVMCDHCAVDVYDFRNKTSDEIRAILLKQGERKMCGRFYTNQIDELNADFETWKFNSKRSMQRAMVFSLVAVFGLTLFSCTNQRDEKLIAGVGERIVKVVDENLVEDLVVENEKIEVKAEPVLEAKLVLKEAEMDSPAYVEKCLIDIEKETQKVEMVSYTQEDGGVGWSTEYVMHLADVVTTIHEPEVIELDKNGMEFPKEYNAIAYPNPANEKTTIKIELPADQERVTVNLFSMSGSLVSNVYSDALERGTHEFNVDLIDLKPGIYLATIIAPSFKKTVRISKN